MSTPILVTLDLSNPALLVAVGAGFVVAMWFAAWLFIDWFFKRS